MMKDKEYKGYAKKFNHTAYCHATVLKITTTTGQPMHEKWTEPQKWGEAHGNILKNNKWKITNKINFRFHNNF